MYEDVREHLTIQKIIILAIVVVVMVILSVKIFNYDKDLVAKIEEARLEAKRYAVEENLINSNIFATKVVDTIATEEIPFGTITNGRLNGSYISKVVNEGETGEKVVAYRTTYLGSKEVSKEVIAEVVSKEAVDAVVENVARTASNVYISRSSNIKRGEEQQAPTTYKEVKDMKATAYCLCKKCCGKSESDPEYGVTRSGLKIVPNTGMKVIAVDPKVIPLGSWVYVEGLNGAEDYGYAIAADTGSAIKNNKIDLYMESHKEAWDWATQNVRVYIVE